MDITSTGISNSNREAIQINQKRYECCLSLCYKIVTYITHHTKEKLPRCWNTLKRLQNCLESYTENEKCILKSGLLFKPLQPFKSSVRMVYDGFITHGTAAFRTDEFIFNEPWIYFPLLKSE